MEIDWSSAEVADGDLTVGLKGEAGDEWGDRLRAVIDRLSRHGHWGDIELGDDGLEVKAVQEGSEEELKFFLESAVLQADAGEPEDDGSEDGDGDDDDEGEPEDDADARMTEVFRSFA